MDYIFNTKSITRHFVEKIILIYTYNTVAFSSRTVGFWTLFKKIQLHPKLVEYRIGYPGQIPEKRPDYPVHL